VADRSGYSGAALKFLEGCGAEVGDVVEVKTEWGTVTGTVVPRYAYGGEGRVVLKLRSGYNVGLDVAKLKEGKVKSKGELPSFSAPKPPEARKGLPRVLVIGTGGTIASRVDYRTGAVRPAVSAAELHSLIPELSDVANVAPEILFNILSENITPAHWSELAERVKRAVREGFDGVVVTHGTDTLGYTAAALAFALSGVPVPVVLVGAQRSSDRPSSDSAQNLIAGVSVAAGAPFSGVYVAMHLDENDEAVAVHRATRVRKSHTSRRDAFRSVGVPLAAVWREGRLESVDGGLPKRGGKGFSPRTAFDGRAVLLKFYPSMPPSVLSSAAEGARGVVLEGTGLGHVSSGLTKVVEGLTKKEVLVGVTSQCIEGSVNLNVYETGRDLQKAGALPLGDMLSETALVKMMWVLGGTESAEEAKESMLRDEAGETTLREFPG
jgi:glutamyl-tRNA(Gln) amidotransferase subunit D